MTGARPGLTRAGWGWCLLTLAVLLTGLRSGDNGLLAIGSVSVALGLVELVVGAANMWGLDARRGLPSELFAGRAGAGVLVVRNRRRLGAAWGVRVAEADLGDGARGVAERVPAGGERAVPVRWRIAARGVVRLRGLTLESALPFGLVRWRQHVNADAELLVYPRPEPGLGDVRRPGVGQSSGEGPLPGGEGAFRGLRPYSLGDSLRRIHWPTSARAGSPMVVERTLPQADAVVVVVDDRPTGPSWERELSRATGVLEHHFRLGRAVGLEVEGRAHPPRTGPAWRRHLLAALAVTPAREVRP